MSPEQQAAAGVREDVRIVMLGSLGRGVLHLNDDAVEPLADRQRHGPSTVLDRVGHQLVDDQLDVCRLVLEPPSAETLTSEMTRRSHRTAVRLQANQLR